MRPTKDPMRLTSTPPTPPPASTPSARSYWGVPGKILAGFYPGDRDPVVAANKLNALLNCGVTHICSLMEPWETDHAGRPFEDYRPVFIKVARERGLPVGMLHHPIKDGGTPALSGMADTLDEMDAVLYRGGLVYLHCWGGRGRTGTVLGCRLARHGEADPLARLAYLTSEVRTHFPRVPETTGQRQFVRNWRLGQ